MRQRATTSTIPAFAPQRTYRYGYDSLSRLDFADGSSTCWLYDDTGTKLRTLHRVASVPVAVPGSQGPALTETVTDYCAGFVYEDSTLTRINLDGAYLSYTGADGSRLTTPEYHFYLRDHLGNNRVDVAADGRICQVTDYYPYGLPMASSRNTAAQRWLFGGKELDRISGLDLYDFEARAYDPALTRFTSPDALTSDSPWNTPYLYCSANPLNRIDPDGNADYYSNINGKYLGSDGNLETNSIYRLINDEDFSACTNYQDKEKVSTIITINDVKIQEDAQNVRDQSLSTGIENQMYIYLDKYSGEVSSVMGEAGENAMTSIRYIEAPSSGMNYVYSDELPRSKILIGQLHGHPDNDNVSLTTISGMSQKDKETSQKMQIPIYGVDAMKSSGDIGTAAYIHMVNPAGVQQKKIGRTIGSSKSRSKTINIGKQALEIWGRSGKPTY